MIARMLSNHTNPECRRSPRRRSANAAFAASLAALVLGACSAGELGDGGPDAVPPFASGGVGSQPAPTSPGAGLAPGAPPAWRHPRQRR